MQFNRADSKLNGTIQWVITRCGNGSKTALGWIARNRGGEVVGALYWVVGTVALRHGKRVYLRCVGGL